MTEYEAYDALMSLSSQTHNLMFGYFSLVFAFLVMSHMSATKLSIQLVAVVIASKYSGGELSALARALC